MRAIILAAGEATRWGDYLGVRKHLIPIKGEPLVHRTVRMLAERHVEDIVVMARDEDAERYVVPPARRGVPDVVDREWVQEMEPSRKYWAVDGRTMILYGDCYFSDAILDEMVKDPGDVWHVYARRDGSEHTGKTWGEMFGWVFSPQHHRVLDDARNAVIRFRNNGVMKRALGWEVHQMATVGMRGWNTQGPHFVQWDDETDDFDYPSDWDVWAAHNPDLV